MEEKQPVLPIDTSGSSPEKKEGGSSGKSPSPVAPVSGTDAEIEALKQEEARLRRKTIEGLRGGLRELRGDGEGDDDLVDAAAKRAEENIRLDTQKRNFDLAIKRFSATKSDLKTPEDLAALTQKASSLLSDQLTVEEILSVIDDAYWLLRKGPIREKLSTLQGRQADDFSAGHSSAMGSGSSEGGGSGEPKEEEVTLTKEEQEAAAVVGLKDPKRIKQVE